MVESVSATPPSRAPPRLPWDQCCLSDSDSVCLCLWPAGFLVAFLTPPPSTCSAGVLSGGGVNTSISSFCGLPLHSLPQGRPPS